VKKSSDHQWERFTEIKLNKIASEISQVTNEINDARMFGFLAEALHAKKTKSVLKKGQ
jgi:hypothetical protein